VADRGDDEAGEGLAEERLHDDLLSVLVVTEVGDDDRHPVLGGQPADGFRDRAEERVDQVGDGYSDDR
jgi:hypothetical protein